MSLPSVFDWQPRTRVVFGPGTLDQLGSLARELGMTRVLLVSDPGIVQAGYASRATHLLTSAGMEVTTFSGFDANPDDAMIAAGAAAVAGLGVNGLVALGGGSSLDCAKGINFLLTGGGVLADYRGYGRARGPMLPMIGVPTTAGTGSDAQSYAVISDASTHVKMACGDPGAAFRLAILDPDLTRTQPHVIAATAGYDALSHAVEAWVTTKRTTLSQLFAREAWRLVNGQIERALQAPGDDEARGALLLGAHLAGLAVEHSMLGAAHACANPLTARFGTTHGIAVALMLPHVVRWNAETMAALYAELVSEGDWIEAHAGERLATRLESLSRTCGFPATLIEAGVTGADLPALADAAVAQWTGTFNPRPLTRDAALALYRTALA
jgi:alcohol dehydrogenase